MKHQSKLKILLLVKKCYHQQNRNPIQVRITTSDSSLDSCGNLNEEEKKGGQNY